MPSFDLIIIGAGPAGLFAGIHSARPGCRICILEKNATAGAKLLLTGGGKCNISHSGSREGFLRHFGAREKGRFVKPSLYDFGNRELSRFFGECGISFVTTDDGKIFPASMRSGDILQALVVECAKQGTEIRYREPAIAVERVASGFIVTTPAGRYETMSLLIAAGGVSYPKTGSNGDGYSFARALGHNVVYPAPALAPVTIRDFRFGNCSGISVNDALITIVRHGKKAVSLTGDALFTHHGLSGPGILDSSRYIEPGDTIMLSMVPSDQCDGFPQRFAQDLVEFGAKPLKSCLKSYGIPERLVNSVIGLLGFSLMTPCSNVTRKTRQEISAALTGQPFVIERVNGFDQAMVTRGGVALSEVSPGSMESRIVPGLFFAGEVLDIDGDTGGYNLQFAFSSGYAAGKHAASWNTQR